jgi:hypothetical protein
MKTTKEEKLRRILDSCTTEEQRQVALKFINTFKEEGVYYDKLAHWGHVASIVALVVLIIIALGSLI